MNCHWNHHKRHRKYNIMITKSHASEHFYVERMLITWTSKTYPDEWYKTKLKPYAFSRV